MTQALPENKRAAGEGEGCCCEQVENKLEMLVFIVTFFLNMALCSPGCSQTQYIAEDDFVAFPF